MMGVIVMSMIMVVVVLMVMVAVIMIMIVVMIMAVVVMGVIVVMMIMLMRMIVLMNVILFILHQRLQFLARHLLFRDSGLRHDEIDDLLLEDGAAQLKQGIGVLAIVVEHPALLAGELAGAIDEGALQLVFGDSNAFPLAQRAEHQTQAHAAFGNGAVFLARLLLGGVLVGEALA